MDHQTQMKHLQRIKRFRLMDDTFFAVCIETDNRFAEFLLRIMLDKDDLQVIRTQSQYTVKNLLGHSVIFDAYATDCEGKQYDIEVQRSNRGAVPQRARYHSSMIDGRILVENEAYHRLAESYVIFITENDVIGAGLPIYHIDRQIAETGKPFNDGAHIVYINAENVGDRQKAALSPLEKLIHDFNCADPNDMYYDVLAQKAKYFKEDDKGVNHMCQIIEEMCEEVRQEAEAKFAKEKAETEAKFAKERAEAEEKFAKERAKLVKENAEAELKFAKEKAESEAAMKNAIKMIKDGLRIDKISEYTGMPVEKVQELADLIA